jgi:hypothetical protein
VSNAVKKCAKLLNKLKHAFNHGDVMNLDAGISLQKTDDLHLQGCNIIFY